MHPYLERTLDTGEAAQQEKDFQNHALQMSNSFFEFIKKTFPNGFTHAVLHDEYKHFENPEQTKEYVEWLNSFPDTDKMFKEDMKRIPIKHGSARVSKGVGEKTIDALNKLSEAAYLQFTKKGNWCHPND